MAFKLENVVPWGRNIQEYRNMFVLTDADMQKKLLISEEAHQALITRQHSKAFL